MDAVNERDPDLQREVDRAVSWWSRYLSGRLLPGIDPEIVARHGVEAMLTEHWRPIKPPPDWRSLRDQRPADPGRKAAVVQELRDQKGWARPATDTEGEQL